MPIVVDGKTLETDEEGYLANINDWVPGVANVMAKEDDLDLNEEHWEIINFLREYYEEYQIAPAVRVLTKAVGKKMARTRAPASTSMASSPMDPPSRPAATPVCPSPLAASDPRACARARGAARHRGPPKAR